MPEFNIKYGLLISCTLAEGETDVVIPDGVTSISGTEFGGCTGLTSAITGDRLTSIGEWVFTDWRGLTSATTIGGSVTSTGVGAFQGCTGLTSVTIPNSVTSIGSWAFGSCTGLTEVVIPGSVKRIGDGAFRGCSDLTSVIIPDSVTNIGEYAFAGCTNIKAIQVATEFDLAQLRGAFLTVEPVVTREQLCFSVGGSPKSIMGQGAMQRAFAKLLFLCGERIVRINKDEENTSVNKLPILPEEIWFKIMSIPSVEYVPKKVEPISSDALMLTDGDKAKIEEYKQFKRTWQEYNNAMVVK